MNERDEKERLQVVLNKIHESFTVEQCVQLYIQARDQKQAVQRAADAEQEKFKQIMDACSNSIMKQADADGVEGYKTQFGTTYSAVSTKCSVADGDAFYNFVLAKGDLDFFERRISSRHVEEYMQENEGQVPPGISIFKQRETRIRKA